MDYIIKSCIPPPRAAKSKQPDLKTGLCVPHIVICEQSLFESAQNKLMQLLV